jgi:hypothetical protein
MVSIVKDFGWTLTQSERQVIAQLTTPSKKADVKQLNKSIGHLCGSGGLRLS